MKFALKKSKCVFFQNETNMNLVLEKGIVKGTYKLIPGSGVNVSRYPIQSYPKDDKKIVFNYIGRVLSEIRRNVRTNNTPRSVPVIWCSNLKNNIWYNKSINKSIAVSPSLIISF